MKRFLPTLRRIHRMGEKAKREYVKRCNRQFIDCVSECAKNVLKGNVPLTDAQMSKLRPRRRNAKLSRKAVVSRHFWQPHCPYWPVYC